MGILNIYDAAVALGYTDISVEPDGTIWLGAHETRTYLTAAQQKAVLAKVAETAANATSDRASALAKLKVLGLTDDEIAALIGG